jgi:branched-chain amino acid aminotransferase
MSVELTATTGFLRDRFVPFGDMSLSIANSSVLHGLATFTVLPACWDDSTRQLFAFRLADHYRRLCDSASIIGLTDFAATWSPERFSQLVLNLLRRNDVRESVYVRVILFVDEILSGTRIADMEFALAAFLYPPPVYPCDGLRLCVSTWARNSDNSIPTRAKVNGAYINAALMKDEALAHGYDDAIALDTHGNVTEVSTKNICIVRQGTIISPDAASDALEGITLRSVAELASSDGIPVVWRPVSRTELYVADEIFTPGALTGPIPVLSVDRRPTGSGGELTNRLQQLYRAAIRGNGEPFAHWATPVYESS